MNLVDDYCYDEYSDWVKSQITRLKKEAKGKKAKKRIRK